MVDFEIEFEFEFEFDPLSPVFEPFQSTSSKEANAARMIAFEMSMSGNSSLGDSSAVSDELTSLDETKSLSTPKSTTSVVATTHHGWATLEPEKMSISI